MRTKYAEFIERKTQVGSMGGFDPLWMPDFLFDFQRHLVEWAIRKGRAAIFAECGLGKSPMQLVWAENVRRKTDRPVLILTPLSVASQTVHEGEKFGIECMQCRDGVHGSGIVVSNYERLHHFDPSRFGGVVCDESSILKNFDGKTRDAIVEFMRTVQYRLLCTATAAPNDYVELGNSSESLGEMGFQDMVSRFFRQETSKDYLGWGRTKYKLRGHAARDFWRWVCSWSRAVRKPSDLGFDDTRFVLPPLDIREHLVKPRRAPEGFLFSLPGKDLHSQREETRRTLDERCETVASLLNDNDESCIAWCHLNDEGDLLERLIDGGVQVSGSDSDDRKEEVFNGFASGQIRAIVTKPSIAGFGMNWQHCSRMSFFPSHSFEQYYQSVRRCWRFGQTRPVRVELVASESGSGVRASLQRKAEAAEEMFDRLVEMMNNTLRIESRRDFSTKEIIPSWLAPIK